MSWLQGDEVERAAEICAALNDWLIVSDEYAGPWVELTITSTWIAIEIGDCLVYDYENGDELTIEACQQRYIKHVANLVDAVGGIGVIQDVADDDEAADPFSEN